MQRLLIEVSPGELLDRIGILQLKLEHLRALPARQAVERELEALFQQRDASIRFSAELRLLAEELAGVNRVLWRVEDELRLCEQRGQFDAVFVEMARGVYQNNDRRSLLKRRINELLGSSLTEQKVYPSG